ncbi:MAG: hypothetical protein FWC79_07340 [Oscillospiraceae bacterium]|nr:hypothetical protein [Oscillospiraceae bacterium]
MKKIIEVGVNIKSFAGMVFMGALIIYMIAKSILGIYEVSFITIIGLAIMAALISGVIFLFESDVINRKISRFHKIADQYLAVCIIVFATNHIFNYFILSGIQYLYFLLFITACHLGGVLAFYIISKMELDVLNFKLKKYNSGL